MNKTNKKNLTVSSVSFFTNYAVYQNIQNRQKMHWLKMYILYHPY